MILVDTSIWVGHLRSHDADLACLIDADAVSTHPYVIGEVALRSLRQRAMVLKALQSLPHTLVATEVEVIAFIENLSLFGRGIGYVDACLLAAARMTPNTWLWTNDKKLHAVASELGVAQSPPFSIRALG